MTKPPATKNRSEKWRWTAARRLTGKLDAAVGLLSSVIDDDEAPAAVRLRAASQVIDGSLKLLEITDIQERLMALEERLEHA